MRAVDLREFARRLAALNQPQLAGFARWLFPPGTQFGAGELWWGARQRRPTPHEGVDLYMFQDVHGRARPVDATLRIPAAAAGVIALISDDFLGKSIFVRHAATDPHGRRLYTICGHTRPRAGLAAGTAVRAGEALGRLAPGPGTANAPPPHLHLSVAWAPAAATAAQLAWPNLGRDPAITLLDPEELLT